LAFQLFRDLENQSRVRRIVFNYAGACDERHRVHLTVVPRPEALEKIYESPENREMTKLPGATLSAKLLHTPEIQARLKKIKLLLLDVDGVMTDGRIFWLESQGWTRQFNVKDGYGLKILMKAGIQVGIISGGESKDVRTRAEFLKVQHIFLGDEDKIK